MIKTRYDRLELESHQLAATHISSYDIKTVLVQVQVTRKSWLDHLRYIFTNALREANTVTGCRKLEEEAEGFLSQNSVRFECYSSALFIPMPLQIVSNPEASVMRASAIEKLKELIICSTELLSKENASTATAEVTIREQIEGAGDNHQAIENEANRLLVELLKKQRAVRI